MFFSGWRMGVVLGMNSVNVTGFCNICSSLEVDTEPSAPNILLQGRVSTAGLGPWGYCQRASQAHGVSLSPLGPTPLGVGAGNSSYSRADNQRAAKKSPLSLGTVALSLQSLFWGRGCRRANGKSMGGSLQRWGPI